MRSKVVAPRIFGGLLTMTRKRQNRLKTLRWVISQDDAEVRVTELVRIFCRVEIRITEDKIFALRLKGAKLRHLREARDVMISAGAERYDPDALEEIEKLIDLTENPPPPEPLIEGREHILLEEQDVLLLQMSAANVGLTPLENLVFQAFWAARAKRRAGSVWLAFKDSERVHHRGRSDWIGLSRSVPTSVVDSLQASFEALGLEVEREMGRALRLGLTPFARLCDEDLEILVPAAIAGDPREHRKVNRGETTPIARGYYLKPLRSSPLP